MHGRVRRLVGAGVVALCASLWSAPVLWRFGAGRLRTIPTGLRNRVVGDDAAATPLGLKGWIGAGGPRVAPAAHPWALASDPPRASLAAGLDRMTRIYRMGFGRGRLRRGSRRRHCRNLGKGEPPGEPCFLRAGVAGSEHAEAFALATGAGRRRTDATREGQNEQPSEPSIALTRRQRHNHQSRSLLMDTRTGSKMGVWGAAPREEFF